MNQPSVPVQYSTQDKLKLAAIGIVCCIVGSVLTWFVMVPFASVLPALGLLYSNMLNKQFLKGTIPSFLPQHIMRSEKYGDATAATTAMQFGFIASMIAIFAVSMVQIYLMSR